jgi:RNA polymerase sigma-70 factor (ECF subfamily)
LLAIVADQARRHRTRGPRPTTLLADDALTAGPTEPDVDLERAVARLPQRQRQAVDLYYFVGLDVASTAQTMGCAPGTVQATLHQARARLRELLGDSDD